MIRNSIMGGLCGFNATFSNRIHRWLEQVTAGVAREEIEASGEEGLAVQEIIEAAIRSIERRQRGDRPARRGSVTCLGPASELAGNVRAKPAFSQAGGPPAPYSRRRSASPCVARQFTRRARPRRAERA